MKVTLYLEGKSKADLAKQYAAHAALFGATGKATKAAAEEEEEIDETEEEEEIEASDDADETEETEEEESDDADETEEEEEEAAPKKSAKGKKKAAAITTEQLNDACKDRLKRIMKKRKITSKAAFALVKSLLNKHFDTESVSKIEKDDRARALELLSAELK